MLFQKKAGASRANAPFLIHSSSQRIRVIVGEIWQAGYVALAKAPQ
jgi:hypothetical protein